MKNNRGFTVVELLVSLTLSFVVAAFLFETVIMLKNIYNNISFDMQLLSKQNIVIEKINSDLINKYIYKISNCDGETNFKNCMMITYHSTNVLKDYETIKLSISKDDRLITYGDYKAVFPEHSEFSDITFKINDLDLSSDSNEHQIIQDDIIFIKIPIKGELNNKDYNINISNQYKGIAKVIYADGSILYYDNIQTAINSASNSNGNTEIKLLKNIVLNNTLFVQNDPDKITFNLNNFNISASNSSTIFNNEGNLKINGSGNIVNSGNGYVFVNSGNLEIAVSNTSNLNSVNSVLNNVGNVTLASGNFNSQDACALYNSGGNANIGVDESTTNNGVQILSSSSPSLSGNFGVCDSGIASNIFQYDGMIKGVTDSTSLTATTIQIPEEFNTYNHSNLFTITLSPTGLYTDELDSTRKVFRGSNPNNYIYFDINGDRSNTDDELYRIMAVESDGRYKITRDGVIGSSYFDVKTSDTRQNTSNTYCNYNYGGVYYGCNILTKASRLIYNGAAVTNNTIKNGTLSGTVTVDSTVYKFLENYYNNTISSTAKNYMVQGDFYVGGITYQNIDIASAGTEEKLYKYSGYFGLLTYTDWFKASTYSDRNVNTTRLENYLFINTGFTSHWWLSNARLGMYNQVNLVNIGGQVATASAGDSNAGVRPAFYLRKDLVFDGSGTKELPFTISLLN